MAQKVKFLDPTKKLKLKTFRSLSIKTKVKTGGKIVQIKADKELFARLVIIAQARSMDLKQVLQYLLGPVPWSLATADGAMCKTPKSKLLPLLESAASPVEQPPHGAAHIIDGMAMLQAFKGVPSTFGDLADQLLRLVVARLSAASRVDVVFNCYNDMSIKSFERNKRAGTESLLVAIAGSTTKCPKQWGKALHVSANEAAIVSFLVEEWQKVKYAPLIAQRSLFVTSGEQCWLFRTEASDGTVTVQRFAVPELECSHEEADTRMLLHAQHAANTGQASVIIRSPDTDVAVIACSLASQIQARLIFQTETTQRMRYLDLTAIAASFGQGVATALIGMHSMTGCDTTSAFSGRGKKAAFA